MTPARLVDRVSAPKRLRRLLKVEPTRSIVSDQRTMAKIAVAAGVAWWLGNLAGQSRPVFASLVPILVIRSDTTDTMRGSLGRVVGVLLGVGLGLASLEIARPSPLSVGLTVAAALVIDRFVQNLPHVELDTRNQTAVSALIMLFVASSVTSYAVARLWETAMGGALALLIDGLDDVIGRRLHARRIRTDRESVA
jgi:uncharacterized membrane protein YgaE (UPF0421/DUF939 family)